MRSRAIVFAAFVLLVAPLSFMKHRCHRDRALDREVPLPAPETPLDRLAR